jgi:hypothetical protein
MPFTLSKLRLSWIALAAFVGASLVTGSATAACPTMPAGGPSPPVCCCKGAESATLSLRVRTANTAFYRDFHASKDETEGRFVYELGNGQWDIPRQRTFLVQVLSNSHAVEDFEGEHTFPAIGRRKSDDPDLVLLAIEDIPTKGGPKPL